MTNEAFIKGLLNDDNFVIKKVIDEITPSFTSFVLKNKGHKEVVLEIILKCIVDLQIRIKDDRFKIKSNYSGYLFRMCQNQYRRHLNSPYVKNRVSLNSGNYDAIISVPAVEYEFSEQKKNDRESKKIEPNEIGETTIGITLVNEKLKLVELDKDNTYRFLDHLGGLHNILYTYDPGKIMLNNSIQEFEYLINSKNTKEDDLQNFFEIHPNFIINDEYKHAHSKIILDREDEGILIPDFVLEPINQNALSDILEIKLPSSKLIVGTKNRRRFSASVLEACAQIRKYSQYFENPNRRIKIEEKYGLSIYKPNCIVLIGKKGNLDKFSFNSIKSDLPQYSIRTYDEILQRMKYKIR